MSTESLRDFLAKREKELTASINQMRRAIIPFESELAEVRRAKAAVGLTDTKEHEKLQTQYMLIGPDATRGLANPYLRKSMKQLAVEALKTEFKKGATAAQLLQFFHDAWGRTDISRESLSPQLSRLKASGVLLLDGKTWFLGSENSKKTEAADDTSVGEASAASDQKTRAEGREAGPGGGT
jgi:hypothetical protein